MYRKIIKIDSREMMKRVGMFRFVSVAFGNSRRTECLPIMRSRDSDTKNMSESSKRPPEPRDAACQNRSYFIEILYSIPPTRPESMLFLLVI